MTPSTKEYSETSEFSDVLSLSLKRENISYYGGILSNLSDDHSLTDFSDNNDNHKNTNNTQNVTFQWDEEESDSQIVYLTGNFCKWKQYFIMPKINNIFTITLPLPKDLHKFKFRINDAFKLNKNYPIMKDGDTYCNYIDTSEIKDKNTKSRISSNNENNNFEEDSNEEENSLSCSDSSLLYEPESEDEEDRIKRLRKLKIKKIKYSQIFPKKGRLNNYPPNIPYCYNYMYNIDIISPQKNIGKSKYYEPKENNILGDNSSYKKIEVLPASEINHIHSNNLIVSGKRSLCSSFVRYRNKFITLLYYKPFNQ